MQPICLATNAEALILQVPVVPPVNPQIRMKFQSQCVNSDASVGAVVKADASATFCSAVASLALDAVEWLYIQYCLKPAVVTHPQLMDL